MQLIQIHGKCTVKRDFEMTYQELVVTTLVKSFSNKIETTLKNYRESFHETLKHDCIIFLKSTFYGFYY